MEESWAKANVRVHVGARIVQIQSKQTSVGSIVPIATT